MTAPFDFHADRCLSIQFLTAIQNHQRGALFVSSTHKRSEACPLIVCLQQASLYQTILELSLRIIEEQRTARLAICSLRELQSEVFGLHGKQPRLLLAQRAAR